MSDPIVRVYLAEHDDTTTADIQAVIDGRSDACDVAGLVADAEVTVRFQLAEPVETSTCRHCDRHIEFIEGLWVDPEAGDDVENGDGVWRETCDAHDTFQAEHEPAVQDEPSKYAAMTDAEIVDEIGGF